MTKQAARTLIKEKIKQFDLMEKEKADQGIYHQVIESSKYKEAQTIFCYVSTSNEVNTWPIIAKALEDGKIVTVPLCVGKGIMEARRIQSLNDLKKGAYGIMEPEERCEKMSKDQIDLAIIPCVGADKEGRRLGHGAGFYDRFLQETHFFKMMICYERFMLEKVPTEEHDILMDQVIYQ